MLGSLWRLTRNPRGRRLYESLDAIGVTVALLQVYRRPLGTPSEPELDGAILRYHSPEALGGEFRDADALDRADRVVAAYADGTRIGSVLVTTGGPLHVDPLDRQFDPDGAYVWRLYVASDHRNEGVGRRLVRAALWAAARTGAGVDAATALIARDNVPSRRTFEAVGFEPEREHLYLRVPGAELRRSHEL